MASDEWKTHAVYAGTALTPVETFRDWSHFYAYALENLAPGGIAVEGGGLVRCEAVWRPILVTLRAVFESERDDSVLVTGPTGTGKEYFARLLHLARFWRAPTKHPFVVVHLSSYSQDLVESELLGYVEGAFTGARKGGRAGLLQAANRGTVFLDEVGDIPRHTQDKLMRVVENKQITRVGSNEPEPVTFMAVAATNRDLLRPGHGEAFRQDLTMRLSRRSIALPALRERAADVSAISESMFATSSAGLRLMSSTVPKALSEDTLQLLSRATWRTGNLRQLQAALTRIIDLMLAGVSEKVAADQVVDACYIDDCKVALQDVRRRSEAHYAALAPLVRAQLVEQDLRRRIAEMEAEHPVRSAPAVSLPDDGPPPYDLPEEAFLLEMSRRYYVRLKLLNPNATQETLARLAGVTDRTLRSKLSRFAKENSIRPQGPVARPDPE